MAVSFWAASITVCVCFGVLPRECRSLNLPRPFGEARWHFGLCHHRWWNIGLPIRPWNEAAKCTMEDCQFRTTKKIPSVQIKSQNNVFLILEGLFIMNLYCTKSPSILGMPWLARCGRWNFLQDMGVVHRITQFPLFVYWLILYHTLQHLTHIAVTR
jgi:hypothetical protein